jgi:hypothetical protein
MQRVPDAGKLSLEWVILPDGRPALAFDKPTWIIYEETAAPRRQTAQQMITASVVAALGPILVDHYSRPANDLRQPISKDTICAQLVQLICLAGGHGIDIEALIHEALDIADVEPS